MSCYSTVTGTSLATLSSESVSTSYSTSVSSYATTKSTVTSCGTATFGLFPVPTCSTFETTIGGGATTLQIPIMTTVTLTQAITNTLYGTTCSSGSTSAQTSAPSSGSSGSTATSTSDGSTSSSDAQTSAESSSPPSSTTFLLQSTETTVVGGSTVTTQITSLEVVAVTASSTLAASLPSGSSTSSDSAPTGAIIGAIIGGIAALVLLAFGFAFFSRGKKRPDDVQEKDPEPDMTTLASRMLRKRRDKKGDIDIDAEARPFTEGLPYQLGDISVNTIPPTPPQKDLPMRFASKLKPLPKSPRATWYSVVPSKSPPPDQSDRSSIATIRATPRATPASQPLPQLTVNPPSPRLPMLHVSNVSPRNSALLTPPPLPEKSHFLPRPRRGKAPERQDGAPPASRSHTPRTSLRASFFGTPSLRMPVPSMPAIWPVVQHEDGGPAQAGPSAPRRDKAAEAASERPAEGSGDMPPPAYSA